MANYRLSQKDVMARLLDRHTDYDYSKVNYVDNRTKIEIVCHKKDRSGNTHGIFYQYLHQHLRGAGCPKCAIESRVKTQENFIQDSIKLWGDGVYVYDKVDYKTNKKHVLIGCPRHGYFKATPNSFLRGFGCPKCGRESAAAKIRSNVSEFKQKATAIHKGSYNYDNVKYVNSHTSVDIVCPIHGLFKITPNAHLAGHGCPKCGIIKRGLALRLSHDEFIEKAQLIHPLSKYDYSRANYTVGCDAVEIGCPKHGWFKVKASDFLAGKGCRLCSISKGEKRIAQWLDAHDIKYETQVKISPAQRVLFLRNTFVVDFFISDFNTIIEYNGEQHYNYVPHFHDGNNKFEQQQDRDKRLREHCKAHGIQLIEIPYTKFKEINDILGKKIGPLM